MAICVSLSQRCSVIATLLATVWGAGLTVGQTAWAQSIDNAQTQLLKSRASVSIRRAPARYYFTVQVPKTAPPLKAIKVEKILGVDDIAFHSDASKAFVGISSQGTAIPLAAVGGAGEDNTLTVAFDQPVQPGTTVTIAVRPGRNPSTEGVYLFRLTGFTTDSTDSGQHFGVGRIHIYS